MDIPVHGTGRIMEKNLINEQGPQGVCMKKVLLIAAILVSVVVVSEAAEVVKLPDPKHMGRVSVEEAIYKRRSIRSFGGTPLTLEQVSQLLWAAAGKTVDGVTGPTRAYPSAGATYPLEIYLVAGNVEELEPGVYHYNWKNNSLKQIRKGDMRNALARAAYGQSMVKQAPATIVVNAVFERTAGRYGDRGMERYVPMDAGHLGQNVHLQAESMGLGTVMVGAFTDKEAARVISAKNGIPVYMMPVGKPR
jgi:SagB-type dehydrogenase family enzyme